MIVPICLVLARRFGTAKGSVGGSASGSGEGSADAWSRFASFVPGFLVLFVVMAGLRGTGVIPAAWAGGVSEAATLLITLALSAVGLSVDLGALRRAGVRPLMLGAVLWVAVSLLSLGCQAVGLL